MKGSTSSTVGLELPEYVGDKWRRFLDDCFILWNNTIPAETFWAELNSIHPKIQFRNKQLPFLDVLVKLLEGKISTDIYFKPTDMHLYLNFKKGKRKVQGVPQSQTAALLRPQEEEETDKSKQAQTEQTYEKH